MLWDVDGTLLHAGDIGAAVFDDAVEAVLGARPPRRVRMSGKTDQLIVAEYLAMMGVDGAGPDARPGRGPGTVHDAILDALVDRLARAGEAGVLATSGGACPGVVEVLSALGAVPGVAQTLLTGNLQANAVVKVSAYGLQRWLDLEVGAFGSDSMDRNELVPIALERFASLRGERLAPAQTWVVGDTPRDLACARVAGARCLLVATGGHSYDDLAGLGADAVVADLTDTASVVDLVTAGV